ncbi:MAG TPA: zinc-dependent metalloprotease [Candidatus Dormibacteraeota bacterium]|nr:zinc-dependent metalloprotease [Candidatus Dormibacteraeota bacterium]
MPDLKSVLAWSAVAAGVAIAAERSLSKMRGASTDSMLDWELVRKTAYSRAGSDGSDEVGRSDGDYEPLVAELVPLLAEACGTGRQGTNFGRVRVVGRRGFVDQNLAMMQRMMLPIERAQGKLGGIRPSPLMRVPTSLYLGGLLGYMGGRVLGQYDPVLSFDRGVEEGLPTPALLIVEPNVRDFERRSQLPLDSLRRWLMLHELTHAWQFELHPWLAPHLTGMVEELTKLPGGSGVHGFEEMLRAARNVRPQLALVGRVQAVMAVLEGHGNFIMREVGRRHLPDFDTLDQAFHRRHEEPSALERLLLLVSGVGLKLQQYQQGERFLRAVQQVGGQEALDRVWSGPDSLPGWTEVRHPDVWLRRVGFAPGPAPDSRAATAPLPA